MPYLLGISPEGFGTVAMVANFIVTIVVSIMKGLEVIFQYFALGRKIYVNIANLAYAFVDKSR